LCLAWAWRLPLLKRIWHSVMMKISDRFSDTRYDSYELISILLYTVSFPLSSSPLWRKLTNMEPPFTSKVEPGFPSRVTGLSMVSESTSIRSPGSLITSPLYAFWMRSWRLCPRSSCRVFPSCLNRKLGLTWL